MFGVGHYNGKGKNGKMFTVSQAYTKEEKLMSQKITENNEVAAWRVALIKFPELTDQEKQVGKVDAENIRVICSLPNNMKYWRKEYYAPWYNFVAMCASGYRNLRQLC